MKIDELIKQLELLADSCESNYALEINGYKQGVNDAIDVIKNIKQLAANEGCPKCAYPEIVSSIDSFDSSCPNCGNEWTSKT